MKCKKSDQIFKRDTESNGAGSMLLRNDNRSVGVTVVITLLVAYHVESPIHP